MQLYDKPFHDYTDEELVSAYENPQSSLEELGATAEIVLRFYDRHVRDQ